ncbi:MAG: Eco57I restriction-modification methylase domain-containing protein [Myxococcota bacterium]|nr:Eco57I restriction-modification methylase domain-containing protein [Myxococcota bacterium]
MIDANSLSPAPRITPLGTASVRLFVPSRTRHGAVIDSEIVQSWLSRACQRLERLFGGASPVAITGSFTHDDGRITREQIRVVESKTSADRLLAQELRADLATFASEMCSHLHQECVMFTWGDAAYLVHADAAARGPATLRFAQLEERSQLKHLTMGWASIDRPGRIAQLLSLDQWRPVGTVADTDPHEGPRWVLRAVLDDPEARRERRAWSWEAGADTLHAWRDSLRRRARQGRDGSAARPADGDLLFLPSREQDAIDVALLTSNGPVGPRTLRCRHNHLVPVTRHLLLRMLRREWGELEADLEQRALDRSFFTEISHLRERIEREARASLRQSTGHAAAPRARGSQSEANRRAFRFSVRTVGRMVFLRFIAQKGWLPGGVDGLRTAFDRVRRDFYVRFVRPLWHEILHRPPAERPSGLDPVFADLAREGRYPYLDGGLFEREPDEPAVALPDELFDPRRDGSFLNLFGRYEFSLNEWGGSDETLRVDPSVFGKALESFNEASARKKEGIHYTPKPVALALAQEAILQRLCVLVDGVSRAQLDALLHGWTQPHDAGPGRAAPPGPIEPHRAEAISKALQSLHVVDPAVGSGVLLWACLETMLALDSACDGILRGTDGYQRGSRLWGSRARHFVCRCLHGVDVSPEAVELTRLRLWLAVALSEDEPRPLPDLELNVRVADSLAPEAWAASAPRHCAPTQTRLEFDVESQRFNELIRLQRRYAERATLSADEQRRLRDQILQLETELVARGPKRDRRAPSPSTPASFHWDVDFAHVFDGPARGFDVVIANPPYVRIQNVEPAARGRYRETWATLRHGNADLSYAFVELALRRLAAPDRGQIAFIQTNFRHHDAARALRNMLVGRDPEVPAVLRLWVDFDTNAVFETARNYVAMFFAERRVDAGEPTPFRYSLPVDGSWRDRDDVAWLRPRGRTHEHPATDEWLTVEPGLRERIDRAARRTSVRLGDVAVIETGIQTSADEVFLFRWCEPVGAGRVRVGQDASGRRGTVLEAELVRECVKGAARDRRFLLYPYDEDGTLIPPRRMARHYPASWKYLKSREEQLRGRENGRFDTDRWYGFGRQQGFRACNRPKVIVPAVLRADRLAEAIVVDRSGRLALTASGKGGGGAWAVIPREGRASLDEVAALLRSELLWDFARAFGSPQQGGWRGVDRELLARLPWIPPASADARPAAS